MAFRNGRVEFEDRDRESVVSERMPRRPRGEEVEFYERREERRTQSRPPPPMREREREREFDELDVRIRGRERGGGGGGGGGPPPPPGPPSSARDRDFDEMDIRIRERERSRPPPPPPAPTQVREREREFEELDVRIRERDRDRDSRLPSFMRDDMRRTETTGPLVLRQREVETFERPRQRSPTPVRVRETRMVERERERSPSPPPMVRRQEEEIHIRTVERDRIRSPSPARSLERVRTRVVERERERERSLSPSPPPIMDRVRIVERRQLSPPPMERERERIRIVEKERERVPSPSPSPPPPIIRGPIIEREVITHYRDIDHGMIPAPRPPSPPPPPRRPKERDTEIDIYTSRNGTEVDIHKSSGRPRERSKSPERPPARERPRELVQSSEVVVHSDRHRVEVDVEKHTRRRAQSAAPPPAPADDDDDDEAGYITRRIDSRGRMGEAWGGATKDWGVVDVPPGTERVRMDGVGGASAEVTWKRYDGGRRTKFVPERERDQPKAPERDRDRDGWTSVSGASSTVADDGRTRERESRESRLSVQIYDEKSSRGGGEQRDVEVEKVTDRRISIRNPAPPPPPPPKRSDMWTEITKDLITRDAIEELGYEYEETDQFFYVMEYLRYDDVLQLVQVSDRIRRARKDRVREITYEREVVEDRDSREHRSHRRQRNSVSVDKTRYYM